MRIELMKGLYLIGGGRYRYTHPINSNIYLIDGGKEATLIDAGCGFGVESLIESITNHGFDTSRIGLIVNTHSHWDHARGDTRIQKLSNCQIAIHKNGIKTLEQGPWIEFRNFGAPPGVSFEPIKVDRSLKDGDTIDIGNHKLQCIHTPGHTSDSMVFLMQYEGKKVLFSGDTVLPFGKLGIVTAETDFHSYKNSLRRLVEYEVDILLPGHGIFIMAYAHEQIEFALKKISSKWPDFAPYPAPFDSGAWDRARHPEWLIE